MQLEKFEYSEIDINVNDKMIPIWCFIRAMKIPIIAEKQLQFFRNTSYFISHMRTPKNACYRFS